jgi:hypothetical protein
MDKSTEYIKMCKMANEIQELRGPSFWEEGDFYTAYNKEKVFVYSGEGEDEPYENSEPVWLPRQGQLQEMINNNNIEANLDLWGKWRDESGGVLDPREYDSFIQSMEQCWLIFVMSEKYRKKWTGEEWKNMKYNKMLGRYE